MKYTWFCNGSATVSDSCRKLQTITAWDGHEKTYLKEKENCPICGKISPLNFKTRYDFIKFINKITCIKII